MQGWAFTCDSRIVRLPRLAARPVREAAPPRWMESGCLSARDEKWGGRPARSALAGPLLSIRQAGSSSHLLLHHCHSCSPRIDLKKAVGKCVEACSNNVSGPWKIKGQGVTLPWW